MYAFRMLGSIGLSTEDGREIDALLRQPKHVALLAYLAMPTPGSWHRRDELIGVFWPELDQARARAALRSALYTLRRHLAEGAIRARGDDELTVDPELITTDVAQMAADLAAGRFADALARYRGELLPSLYVADAEGFEHWVEQQRSRAKSAALKAATFLLEGRESAGDLGGAVEAARRAAELDPDDEAIARRLIALLDRSGDRTQAIAVFERFRSRVLAEFGAQPSAETVALIEKVRARQQPAPSEQGAEGSTPAVAPVMPSIEAQNRAGLPNATAVRSQTGDAGARRARARDRWRLGAAAAVFFIAAAAFAASRRRVEAPATTATHRLVVLPMENETRDTSLDYVAAGIADGVARRLGAMGPFTIRSGARSDWPAAVRHDFKAISKQFGSTVLLRTTLAQVGDSLEVRAAVVDAVTSGENQLPARRFSTAQLSDVESSLAAAVAGAVFRVPIPTVPRTPDRAIDPESYRLMLEGWHQMLTVRNTNRAQELFLQATRLDPGNARAWSGLSSVWGSQTTGGVVPFDVGYDRTSAAAARAIALDSLQGSAWANLAYVRALRYRSLAVSDELMRKAAAAEPGNPEIYLIQSVLYRLAHQWDRATDAIRVARALDALSAVYPEREAFVQLCANRPDSALRMYRAELVTNPSEPLLLRGVTRSLARLGRYDEAIQAWRAEAVAAHDDALATALTSAHGEGVFWALRHLAGRRRLRKLEDTAVHDWIAPYQMIQALFEAGEFDRAFAAIESSAREPSGRLFHLPCMAEADEVRGTARFAAAVARVGALPLR